MSDITVKSVEQFDSPNGWRILPRSRGTRCECLRHAGRELPAAFRALPRARPQRGRPGGGLHGPLRGGATLHAGGETHELVPGTFARVGAGVTRRITTGEQPVQLLAIGGTPGQAYTAPAFTENGAPLPG